MDKRLFRTVGTGSTTSPGIYNGNPGTQTTGCTVTTINDCLATTSSVRELAVDRHGQDLRYGLASGPTHDGCHTRRLTTLVRRRR